MVRTGSLSFRRSWIAVGALLVTCLVWATVLHARHLSIDYDEAVFLQISTEIARTGVPIRRLGEGMPFLTNPPLVLYSSALGRVAGIDDVTWLRTAHVLAWALPLYVAVLVLAWRMFGPGAGALAALCLLGQGFLLREAARIKLDAPLASLSALFLLCVHEIGAGRTRRGRRCAALAATAIAGAACWTKYQGVLLPAFGVVYLLLTRRFDRGRSAPEVRVRAELWILGGTVVCGLGLMVFALAISDSFVDTVRWNLKRLSGTTDEPGFHRSVPGFLLTLAKRIGPAAALGVALAAVLHGFRLLRDARLVLLVLWIASCLLFCTSIGLRAERYFLCAFPAVAVLVGSLASSSAARGWSPSARAGAVAAVALACLLAAVPSIRSALTKGDLQQVDQSLRAIGRVVQEGSETGERVLVDLPHYSLYADRNHYIGGIAPNAAMVFEVLSDPRHGVTYLVTSDSDTPALPTRTTAAEQEEIARYVRGHFERVAGPNAHMRIYRRERW